ncbi:MAG: RNA polymerase subunit sigma-70 [Pirellulales bacterium]|nr:RNA polymerase subunit sigma-70 [Pirellulales bacterium]
MSQSGSVTTWIGALKEGDQLAAQKLWERYFDQLVRLARRKLAGSSRRVADEEDVALIAFDGFCRAATRGCFPQLRDRDDLWRLLVSITAWRAADQIHHQRRQKRGGGKPRGGGVSAPGRFDSSTPEIDQIVGQMPTPEFAALAAEEFQRLLDLLDDETLCRLALWKMEGFSNGEIADRLDCSLRTIERKLHLIRRKWSQEMEP